MEYNAFEVMVLYIPLSSRANVKCKKWLILLGISVLFRVKITKKTNYKLQIQLSASGKNSILLTPLADKSTCFRQNALNLVFFP